MYELWISNTHTHTHTHTHTQLMNARISLESKKNNEKNALLREREGSVLTHQSRRDAVNRDRNH